MKVIKKGRSQKGWAKEFTCTGANNGNGGCGAKLLVEQDDVFETESGHYDGSVDRYATFKCPECGVLTDIPESVQLPFRPRQRTASERTGANGLDEALRSLTDEQRKKLFGQFCTWCGSQNPNCYCMREE